MKKNESAPFRLPSLIGSIVWIISCKTPCLKWFVPECNIGILQLRLGFCNKRQKNGLLSYSKISNTSYMAIIAS